MTAPRRVRPAGHQDGPRDAGKVTVHNPGTAVRPARHGYEPAGEVSVTPPPARDGPAAGQLLVWAQDFGLVGSPREERRLAAMGLDAFAALILPRAGAADLELTAQWAAFICLVDDLFDRRTLDVSPVQVGVFFDRLLDTLSQRPVVRSGTGFTAALADLWRRTAPRMPDQWRTRFITDYTDFAGATRQEIAARRDPRPLPLPAYLRLRRRTITLQPMADILECTAGAALPETHAAAPHVRALRTAAADVAGWTNDLASFEDDLRRGQDNLVTVLARRNNCPVHVAREQARAMTDARLADFHRHASALRGDDGARGAGREHVRTYAVALESFLNATLQWLGATGRFDARWRPVPSVPAVAPGTAPPPDQRVAPFSPHRHRSAQETTDAPP